MLTHVGCFSAFGRFSFLILYFHLQHSLLVVRPFDISESNSVIFDCLRSIFCPRKHDINAQYRDAIYSLLNINSSDESQYLLWTKKPLPGATLSTSLHAWCGVGLVYSIGVVPLRRFQVTSRSSKKIFLQV